LHLHWPKGKAKAKAKSSEKQAESMIKVPKSRHASRALTGL